MAEYFDVIQDLRAIAQGDRHGEVTQQQAQTVLELIEAATVDDDAQGWKRVEDEINRTWPMHYLLGSELLEHVQLRLQQTRAKEAPRSGVNDPAKLFGKKAPTANPALSRATGAATTQEEGLAQSHPTEPATPRGRGMTGAQPIEAAGSTAQPHANAQPHPTSSTYATYSGWKYGTNHGGVTTPATDDEMNLVLCDPKFLPVTAAFNYAALGPALVLNEMLQYFRLGFYSHVKTSDERIFSYQELVIRDQIDEDDEAETRLLDALRREGVPEHELPTGPALSTAQVSLLNCDLPTALQQLMDLDANGGFGFLVCGTRVPGTSVTFFSDARMVERTQRVAAEFALRLNQDSLGVQAAPSLSHIGALSPLALKRALWGVRSVTAFRREDTPLRSVGVIQYQDGSWRFIEQGQQGLWEDTSGYRNALAQEKISPRTLRNNLLSFNADPWSESYYRHPLFFVKCAAWVIGKKEQ